MNVSVALGILVITTSWAWIPATYSTVRSISENSSAVVSNAAAISELAEVVGDMGQLFGNAEILDVGDTMTAQINIHSDAVRFKPGQRLDVTNTGDRREMSVTVEVDGKFESDPYHFLNLSRSAGVRLGARPEDTIQVMIVPAEK